MSIANFIPEVWSARVLFNLRKSLVFANLTNDNYEGEITGVGDTVKITTPASINVGAYSGTVTYQAPTTSQQSLSIDQDLYWAFDVDDADRLQANVDLIDTNTQEAAYALADSVDANLAGLYTDVGHTVNLDISSNFTGVRTALVDAAKNLDDNNVPNVGRWAVVSPTVFRGIKLASDYTPASELGDEMKRAGSIGMLEGFSIYMSRNVAVATQHKCLYGNNSAITLASQLVKTEAIRRDAAFADGIRGRMVFGRKVVRSGALGLLNVTVA